MLKKPAARGGAAAGGGAARGGDAAARGGDAAADCGDPFDGLPPDKPETQHKPSPTVIELSLSKKFGDDKPECDFVNFIHTKLPKVQVTVVMKESEKKVVVTITFKCHEDLDKSKSVLKNLEFPFTYNGKTSNKKSSKMDVVQPKSKSKPKEDDDRLERFPVFTMGYEIETYGCRMYQERHKFLNFRIVTYILARLSRDRSFNSEGYEGMIQLRVYLKNFPGLGCGAEICVPHPHNPTAMAIMTDMIQPSRVLSDDRKNWKTGEIIWVPESILMIPEFWTNKIYQSGFAVESCDDIRKIDRTTIGNPSRLDTGLKYPRFNPIPVIATLIPAEASGASEASAGIKIPFCLKKQLIDHLLVKEPGENEYEGCLILKNKPLHRYAYSIPCEVWRKENPNASSGIFDIKLDRFDQPVIHEPFIVLYPNDRVVNAAMHEGVIRPVSCGTVLVPIELLQFPEAWECLLRTGGTQSW
jgi:hypothetical protein